MQIQLGEGVVLRCAEAVLKGTAHRAARPEIGYDGKVALRVWLKNQAERICSGQGKEVRGAPKRTEFWSWRQSFHTRNGLVIREESRAGAIQRRQRLGGMLNFYYREVA